MPVLQAMQALNLVLLFAGLDPYARNKLLDEQLQQVRDHYIENDMRLASVVFPKDSCPPFDEGETRREMRMELAEGLFFDPSSAKFAGRFDKERTLKSLIKTGIQQSWKRCDWSHYDDAQAAVPCVHFCQDNYGRMKEAEALRSNQGLQWFLEKAGFSDDQIIEMLRYLPKGTQRKLYNSDWRMKAVYNAARTRSPDSAEEAGKWTVLIGDWAKDCFQDGDQGTLFKHIMRGVQSVVRNADCRVPTIDALEVEMENRQRRMIEGSVAEQPEQKEKEKTCYDHH